MKGPQVPSCSDCGKPLRKRTTYYNFDKGQESGRRLDRVYPKTIDDALKMIPDGLVPLSFDWSGPDWDDSIRRGGPYIQYVTVWDGRSYGNGGKCGECLPYPVYRRQQKLAKIAERKAKAAADAEEMNRRRAEPRRNLKIVAEIEAEVAHSVAQDALAGFDDLVEDLMSKHIKDDPDGFLNRALLFVDIDGETVKEHLFTADDLQAEAAAE